MKRGGLYARAVLAFAAPVLVDIVMPAWLVGFTGGRFHAGIARFAGLVPMVLGAWLLLDSVFLRFANEGQGTLMPLDPPKFVVRGGAYRWVRNPMYVANVGILLGTALLFGSWRVLAWAIFVFVAFHLLAVFYEEPTLARQFGDDYVAYRRAVGRWLPRLRG
jgi:protein-S-isoprenylcysteine O-methyltransferase Ste14